MELPCSPKAYCKQKFMFQKPNKQKKRLIVSKTIDQKKKRWKKRNKWKEEKTYEEEKLNKKKHFIVVGWRRKMKKNPLFKYEY